MAEVIGLVVGIGSILKVIGYTSNLIRGISQAPNEALQLADQLDATHATLVSLKATLNLMHRPQIFLEIWTPSSDLVLKNLQTTMEQLHTKLGHNNKSPGRLRLGIWRRVKWQLEKDEIAGLQSQLTSYIQLVILAHNSFTQ